MANVYFNGELKGTFGGGGAKLAQTSVSIASSAWSNKTVTVAVPGVTADNVVLITAPESSYSSAVSAGIHATAQGNGTVSFSCKSVPSAAITLDFAIFT